MVPQQIPASLKAVSSGFGSSAEYNSSRMKGVFIPSSSLQTPSMVGGGEQVGGQTVISGSVDTLEGKQVVFNIIFGSYCGIYFLFWRELFLSPIVSSCLTRHPFVCMGVSGGCHHTWCLSIVKVHKIVQICDFMLLLSCLQIADMPLKLPERDFAGTPYIPVFVMLPVSLCPPISSDLFRFYSFLLSYPNSVL